MIILYRPIEEKDILEIKKLALRSWSFTYKNIYSKNNIKRYVSWYYSLNNFNKWFSNIRKEKDFFVVAEKNKHIVGYAHAGKSKKDWELFRIYVSPSLLRKGIGSALIKRVEKFLKSKKVKSYIVYPHAKNKMAVNFYPKLGFNSFPSKNKGRVSLCFMKSL